jgi:hypothetical protein
LDVGHLVWLALRPSLDLADCDVGNASRYVVRIEVDHQEARLGG